MLSEVRTQIPCEIMLQSDYITSKGYEQRNKILFLQFIYFAGGGGEGSVTFSVLKTAHCGLIDKLVSKYLNTSLSYSTSNEKKFSTNFI